MSEAGERRYRRESRIRGVRSWLHFTTGLGIVPIVLFVARGPWYGIAITAGIMAVLQVIRLVLGSFLPRYPSGVAHVSDVE